MEVEAAKQSSESVEESSQPTVTGGGSSSTLATSGSSGLFVSDHAVYYSERTYIHPDESSTSSEHPPTTDSSSRPRNLSVTTSPIATRPPMGTTTSSDTVFQTPYTQTSGSAGPGPPNPGSASSYPSTPYSGSAAPTSGFGSYQQGFTHVPPEVNVDEYGRVVPVANPPLSLPPQPTPPSGPNPRVLFQSVQNDPDIDRESDSSFLVPKLIY